MRQSFPDKGQGCGCSNPGDTNSQSSFDLFGRNHVTWMVGQCLSHLHNDDANGEAVFSYAVESLKALPGAAEAISASYHASPVEDHALRWSLLYILDMLGEGAEIFYRLAAEPVPPADRYGKGCETPRDGEILVRTMAIAGLSNLAKKDEQARALLFKLLKQQPERALLVEIVKALLLVDSDVAGKIKEVLPADLHFAIDLKQVAAAELAVVHEEKTQDLFRAAPRLDRSNSPPHSHCCS